MKYIILETEHGQKLPIIFPECLVHSHVAGAMQQAILAMEGPGQAFHERQLRGRLEAAVHGLEGAKPVSAGFVSLGLDIACRGKSESLGDLPAGEHDDAIIGVGASGSFMPAELVASAWRLRKAHSGSKD